MERKKRERYSTEFKQQAVERMNVCDNITRLSRELGVARHLLYYWRDRWLPSLIRTVETDDRGNFDFGPLRIGHYTLRIDDSVWFDVEVKDLPQVTESVTIDVSPFYPDCTGGREFLVKTR